MHHGTASADAPHLGAPVAASPAVPVADRTPGLTACSLCSGETLASGDPLPGGQPERLRRLAESGVARVTFVECLDACERGDVVVARPTGRCRRAGEAPVWFERLAGDDPTAALEGWLRSGGPGAAPVPGTLTSFVLERSGAPDEDADAPSAGR